MFTVVRRFACLILLVVGVSGSALAIAGPILYGMTGNNGKASHLYTIDPASGNTTLIGYTGFNHLTGIDFDPTTGLLYGVQSNGPGENQLLTIDTSTGAATVVGATGEKIPDISFSPDGVLHGWSADSGSPVIIDKFTGVVTSTASGLSSNGTGVAWQDESHSYIKNENQLYSVDVISGDYTLLGNLDIGTIEKLRNILENDPNGGLTSSDRFTFYHIDTNSLAVTTLGTALITDGFSAIAYSTISVDEPPAIVLLGLALAGLILFQNRPHTFLPLSRNY